MRRFHTDLLANEALINDLNVFPVPDGDTGTNSALTVAAALPGLDKGRGDLGAVLTALAGDLAMGARGNSGVILAEFVRGLATRSESVWAPGDVADALTAAAAAAQAAVMVPREGTMLSVAAAVAAVTPLEDPASYGQALSDAAHAALAATTDQLDVLRAAGVVDSGAMVLTLLVDALAAELAGRDMPELPVEQRHCDVAAVAYRGPAYEVMYVFDGDAASCESLREELAAIGDSVTVTGTDPWKVHVHVDQPAEAVAEGLRHGRVRDIDITRLLPAINEPPQSAATRGTGLVAATSVPGLVHVIRDRGAVCVPCSESAAPSTREFVDAARISGASTVLLLPSDPDSHASAALAAHELQGEGIAAHVIGTCSDVETLAVLAVVDTDAPPAEVLDTAASAAVATRYGSVAVAHRDTVTPIGPCHRGNTVGLIAGQPWQVSATASVHDMLASLVHTMLDGGGELVTLVVGRDGDAAVVNGLHADHPGVEFQVHAGGQSATAYLVGVE